MESLTPFIRHELEDAPGPSGPPEETSSVVSPPLGAEPGQPPVTEPPKSGRGSQQPPSQPDGPDVQLPPPEVPQPRPDYGIPMTDGTPVACRQKNAKDFLAGDVQTSVMAHYAPGLFSTDQHTHSCHPAPDEDASQVLSLVDWREDAPYG